MWEQKGFAPRSSVLAERCNRSRCFSYALQNTLNTIERWVTMSYAPIYVFIAVSWRASEVSRLRDLVQRGRLLVPEYQGIDSCTFTGRPANGGKASAPRDRRWEGLQRCLTTSAVIWWPSRVPLCARLRSVSVPCGWSWCWIPPPLAVPAGTAGPALLFSAIHCTYPFFSYHLNVSTLSCDFQGQKFLLTCQSANKEAA